MFFISIAATVFLITPGSAIPKEMQRFGRSWEAEACSARNLRNQDRYICTHDGKIQCLDGWIGDLCQVPRCGNDCDPQHGYCIKPGECKCNLGYFGPSCTDCVKLPGCQNGYCKKSFECRCEDGWSGMFCSNPVCHKDCEKNNGFCAGPGKCECKRGYSGDNCTDCSTLPGCKNGACRKPLECICEEGWEGTFCNQPVCADNCSREFGTCLRPGECRCRLGYQGVDCAQCVEYPGCVNGDCVKPYDCNCQEGWTGHLCDVPEVERFGFAERGGRCQPMGSFVCMNGGQDTCRYDGNGTLLGQPQCQCRQGFSGTWCEVQEGGSKEAIEPRNSGTNITVKEVEHKAEDVKIESTSEAAMAEKGDIDDDKPVTNKDGVHEIVESVSIESSTAITEPDVTSDVVDWSKKSVTAIPEKNTNADDDIEKEIDTVRTVPITSSSSQAGIVNQVSDDSSTEFGVRAIHSDVFNSGKLIENYGSEEGLQSFKDY